MNRRQVYFFFSRAVVPRSPVPPNKPLPRTGPWPDADRQGIGHIARDQGPRTRFRARCCRFHIACLRSWLRPARRRRRNANTRAAERQRWTVAFRAQRAVFLAGVGSPRRMSAEALARRLLDERGAANRVILARAGGELSARRRTCSEPSCSRTRQARGMSPGAAGEPPGNLASAHAATQRVRARCCALAW